MQILAFFPERRQQLGEFVMEKVQRSWVEELTEGFNRSHHLQSKDQNHHPRFKQKSQSLPEGISWKQDLCTFCEKLLWNMLFRNEDSWDMQYAETRKNKELSGHLSTEVPSNLIFKLPSSPDRSGSVGRSIVPCTRKSLVNCWSGHMHRLWVWSSNRYERQPIHVCLTWCFSLLFFPF